MERRWKSGAMASEDSITFSVHEVAPAKKRLPKVGLKKLFQSFCDNPEERLKILAVEKITARNFVKTDEDDLSISNGFVGACVSAWNDHYNLELSPDFVWIAIAQVSMKERDDYSLKLTLPGLIGVCFSKWTPWMENPSISRSVYKHVSLQPSKEESMHLIHVHQFVFRP